MRAGNLPGGHSAGSSEGSGAGLSVGASVGAVVGSTEGVGVGSGSGAVTWACTTWLPIAATTMRLPTMAAIVLSRTRRRICPSCHWVRAACSRARSAEVRTCAFLEPRAAMPWSPIRTSLHDVA
jgi:hypothetical protein